MDCTISDIPVNYAEHGAGTPIVVLHGAEVDHREPEACFEPILGARPGYRRIYPDLPGMGRTPAPASLTGSDDVCDLLAGFVDRMAGGQPVLLAGHSFGGYLAQGLAARLADRLAGMALICPLLPGIRDVPEHRPVIAADGLGDEGFRGYFVVQTPEMAERYQRFVAPAAALVDHDAMGRLGQRWELTLPVAHPFSGPTLIVAGRRDSTVGYAAAADLLDDYPAATLAVLDGAGHALPHESPAVLGALFDDWLARVRAAS